MAALSGDLLAVVPVLVAPSDDIGWPVHAVHVERCLDSIVDEDSAFGIDQSDVVVIDNTQNPVGTADFYGLRSYRDPDGHNLGCARSWNVGAREVLDRGLDYLVIVSATVQFGPALQCTWRSQMETHWGARIIEAEGLSWKLIAIHREVFEEIGLFDENLYPAYFEAEDFSFRLRMVGKEGGWPKVWCNAMAQGVAMHTQVVSCPAAPLIAYLDDKWKRTDGKGTETVSLPWGDKPLGYWPERSIPKLARAYRLETWW